MVDIVLATHNPGKVHEFSELLFPLEINILPQTTLDVEEIEETGLSFIENAILKARHASLVTGLPALSDDSGLVVPALNGAPGIYSARYAGPTRDAKAHIDKLLSALQDVPDEKREAHFYCVLAFLSHAYDPTPLICQGRWDGHILREPRGMQGFGYDPVFLTNEKKTAAEFSLQDKMKISHRGQAIKILLNLLPEKLNELSVIR